MDTLQSAMFTTLGQYAGLNALVGSRVYPDVAPQEVVAPYAVWQEISTVQASDLGGSAEINGLSNFRVQVTIWAKEPKGATSARDGIKQVRLAMQAASLFKSLHMDTRAMAYEPDTKLHGMQSDFSVWLKT